MSNTFSYLKKNTNETSFLVYGLSSTGISVVKFFKNKKISNFVVWDDNAKLRKKFLTKISKNLKQDIKRVDYIVLSPGISLRKSKYKKDLNKYKNKIITDIDLLYLSNNKFKSIVVTGTNGKSTTCKIIDHLLRKNDFNTKLGGNIGTPILDLKIKKNIIVIIEASSFQLSHSKFIHPNYAILLNITNDHLDWHGSMKNYTNSKLKIFKLQKKYDFALINKNFKKIFKKNKYLGKFILIKSNAYKNIKLKLKNDYLKSNINDQNMNFVYTISRLFRIKEQNFINSMNTFRGLAHRYEIFLKKKNVTCINDSKATSFEASKYALANSKNIYWIMGGKQKDKDQIDLKNVKKNIIKSYIIGKNISYFKRQLKNKINFSITKNLKHSVIRIFKDIKLLKKDSNTILLSPSAASFDQFKNFENRGNEFKRLCKLYAKKYI